MASEETPLLGLALLDHSRIYDRFSPWEKRGILALVSFSGLIPFLVSGTFIPAIPQIAHDLSTTPETVGLTISLSIFGAAIGSMAMATYSGFSWRFVQNVGVSGGMSLGAGVIGDIYKLEERGFAMGIFYGITLLGPALAPVTGGKYPPAAAAFTALWLPETSHPGTLGAEKQQREAQDMPGAPPRQIDRLGWVWLNPLSCMALLRSPNLLLVMLAGAATLLTDFVLLVPLAYTIGAKYGITNEALIGAVFIPCGMGNIVGAPLAGFLSDRFILARAKHGRQQANGGGGEEEIGAGAGVGWYPEDRLRATLVGAAVCVPLSVLLVGLTTTYVPGRTGLAMCLAWLFMNGLGVDMVLCPSAAYNVDVVHTRSAEIMAANNGARALLISLLVPFILPSITRFGILATNAAAAAIAWGGLGLLLLTIHYGEQLRGWKDIGYSTASNN
ncbi:hypothetical protein EYR38_003434 [Pleurotus pulmonarius]|nr:hypothetical protein EYR38_003434 [Pleurotus pulmonarius]